MSRKKIVRKKRKLILESKYQNPLLTKFMRVLMWDGKLSVAENIVYDALGIAEEKFKKPGIDIFMQAMNNLKPLVKVKARRVGGATYQVPIEVPEELGFGIAMRWVIEIARKRKGGEMSKKLAQEILEAFEGRGDAMKKREETHRMAEANRAFAHYRV